MIVLESCLVLVGVVMRRRNRKRIVTAQMHYVGRGVVRLRVE